MLGGARKSRGCWSDRRIAVILEREMGVKGWCRRKGGRIGEGRGDRIVPLWRWSDVVGVGKVVELLECVRAVVGWFRLLLKC